MKHYQSGAQWENGFKIGRLQQKSGVLPGMAMQSK